MSLEVRDRVRRYVPLEKKNIVSRGKLPFRKIQSAKKFKILLLFRERCGILISVFHNNKALMKTANAALSVKERLPLGWEAVTLRYAPFPSESTEIISRRGLARYSVYECWLVPEFRVVPRSIAAPSRDSVCRFLRKMRCFADFLFLSTAPTAMQRHLPKTQYALV